jgi:hypothetical protein
MNVSAMDLKVLALNAAIKLAEINKGEVNRAPRAGDICNNADTIHQWLVTAK